MVEWREKVVGCLERGRVIRVDVDEALRKDMHLTWGVLFLCTPNRPIPFKELSAAYNIVDTITNNTLAIKVLDKAEFMASGTIPSLYSEAECLKLPSGEWWHFSSSAAFEKAYEIIDKIHFQFSDMEIYWMVDMFPLKLVKVLRREEFNALPQTGMSI